MGFVCRVFDGGRLGSAFAARACALHHLRLRRIYNNGPVVVDVDVDDGGVYSAWYSAFSRVFLILILGLGFGAMIELVGICI